MSWIELVYVVYSASLRAETWRVSGRDMEHAVVDDKVRADAELGVHARRERGTAWRSRLRQAPRTPSSSLQVRESTLQLPCETQRRQLHCDLSIVVVSAL